MFLRMKFRKKDGKRHRYWSVVENQRVHGGSVVQRQLLHLGEINDAQHAGWVRAIQAFEAGEDGRIADQLSLALFPDDRTQLPELEVEAVQIRIAGIRLRRPRQWGGCFLALWIWDMLELDGFWSGRLGESRKGTQWLHVLKTLVCHRLLEPGSEWRLHRLWFGRTAMADLLGGDAALAAKNTLYRCLDQLLPHRDELFKFLRKRWEDLFEAKYDVLLYDLTSTYFESSPPPEGTSKRCYGYSRDHRPDCTQVVIALIVTPEGFPLGYEVYAGNTRDPKTLRAFLDRIEKLHGRIRRTWLMDRGIPTEETLEHMRQSELAYIVGTPKGRLTKMEKALLDRPYEKARENVRVKLLKQDNELYVFVESADRVQKERAMRQRRLHRLWDRLKELREKKGQTRDKLLMRLGAAKKEAGLAWRLVDVTVPKPDEPVDENTFHFHPNRENLRSAFRREGRYLLRTNLTGQTPAQLWERYILLTQIEQAFKDLKGDLSVRPIYHQKDTRIEAHIFVCFLAYCLHITLKNHAAALAPGLTPRAIIDTLSNIQMLDVLLPATDGRTILLTRRTDPAPEQGLLLAQLKIDLPDQPPPQILADGEIKV